MIYAVSPIFQKKQVAEYCFGICKEILIGAIEIGDYSWFYPCRKDVCVYEEKHSPVVANLDGEDVCIRKLKE